MRSFELKGLKGGMELKNRGEKVMFALRFPNPLRFSRLSRCLGCKTAAKDRRRGEREKDDAPPLH